jgi:hypothetical protein
MGQRRLPAPRASWVAFRSPTASHRPRANRAPYASSAMPLRKSPIRSISTSTTSPGFIQSGGVRLDPTPPGVPVTITSPGSSRVKDEQYSIWRGISKMADGCVLNHLAVEAGLQPQWCEIACFVRCHHPGPESAGLRKILAGRELMRVPLKIANAALVVTGVSCDVVPGILAGDVAAWLADDDGEFALEIEIFRDTRPDDVAKMPGLAVGEAAEHGGICDFGAAGFHAVRFIIEANAEDLVRIGYHWQPGDVCEAMSRGLAGRRRHLTQSAGGDGGFQIGISVAKMRAEIDGLCAIDETPARGAVDRKTRKLHRMSRGAGAASQSQWG